MGDPILHDEVAYLKAEIERLKKVREEEDHVFVKLLIDDKIKHLKQRLEKVEQMRALSSFSIE